MKKIIALSGWKGSGKDTLAEYLIQKYYTQRFAFADELKNSVAAEFGIPRHHMDDVKYKDQPILTMPVKPQDPFSQHVVDFMKDEFKENNGQPYWTPRALCILKGSTNRTVNSGYWVEKVIDRIHLAYANLCVITDMRYLSEMNQLYHEFGKDITFIRVERFDNSPSNDPSERDLDDAPFDYYVDNSSTKEYAYQQIETIIEQIIKESENE